VEEKLDILFENESYLIINKQSGVIVNRSDTTKNEDTLQDKIEKQNLVDKNDSSEEFVKRSGIVHRLDKETSGILIIAKNSVSFFSIQKQFKDRAVEKSYIALSHGRISPSSGVIKAHVGRLPWNRKRFGVISGGRESTTFYQVENYFKNTKTSEVLSLVNLFPKTGRTHQIRVHLKHIGYPIFSDQLYGGRKTARNDRKVLSRIFLHAESISFIDPISSERVSYKSSLPKSLKDFLETLDKIS